MNNNKIYSIIVGSIDAQSLKEDRDYSELIKSFIGFFIKNNQFISAKTKYGGYLYNNGQYLHEHCAEIKLICSDNDIDRIALIIKSVLNQESIIIQYQREEQLLNKMVTDNNISINISDNNQITEYAKIITHKIYFKSHDADTLIQEHSNATIMAAIKEACFKNKISYTLEELIGAIELNNNYREDNLFLLTIFESSESQIIDLADEITNKLNLENPLIVSYDSYTKIL